LLHGVTSLKVVNWVTNYLEQSDGREGGSFWGGHEIPLILLNPRISLLCSKAPTIYPIVSQSNPVPSLPCYLFEICFSFMILFMPSSFLVLWSSLFPWGFSTKTLYATVFPTMCHMLCLPHLQWFHHLSNTWWTEWQINSHLILLTNQYLLNGILNALNNKIFCKREKIFWLW